MFTAGHLRLLQNWFTEIMALSIPSAITAPHPPRAFVWSLSVQILHKNKIVFSQKQAKNVLVRDSGKAMNTETICRGKGIVK